MYSSSNETQSSTFNAYNEGSIIMQLLTVQELTIHLKLKSKSTIYRWVSQGKFPEPIINNPKTKRWSTKQLKQWLANQNSSTQVETNSDEL